MYIYHNIYIIWDSLLSNKRGMNYQKRISSLTWMGLIARVFLHDSCSLLSSVFTGLCVITLCLILPFTSRELLNLIVCLSLVFCRESHLISSSLWRFLSTALLSCPLRCSSRWCSSVCAAHRNEITLFFFWLCMHIKWLVLQKKHNRRHGSRSYDSCAFKSCETQSCFPHNKLSWRFLPVNYPESLMHVLQLSLCFKRQKHSVKSA